MSDQKDAELIIQLAQWGTMMGLEDAYQALWDEDFDPETATMDSTGVARTAEYFETIGTLTKNKLLDAELVLDWVWVKGAWDKVGPAARKLREKHGQPALFENFEALAKLHD
ncbi:MAG: DUF4760 domain-containing protein [Nocardioidaceae bacterium]